MAFDPTGFLGGKLAGFILDLGKKTFGKSAEVVNFLTEHGYASLEDDFETLYVHALASRRHPRHSTAGAQGLPTPGGRGGDSQGVARRGRQDFRRRG